MQNCAELIEIDSIVQRMKSILISFNMPEKFDINARM